jgi:hypothetical protein
MRNIGLIIGLTALAEPALAGPKFPWRALLSSIPVSLPMSGCALATIGAQGPFWMEGLFLPTEPLFRRMR